MEPTAERIRALAAEKHAVILFDPKKSAFWLQPGDGSGLVYLNGELVHSPSALKPDDVIEVGVDFVEKAW